MRSLWMLPLLWICGLQVLKDLVWFKVDNDNGFLGVCLMRIKTGYGLGYHLGLHNDDMICDFYSSSSDDEIQSRIHSMLEGLLRNDEGLLHLMKGLLDVDPNSRFTGQQAMNKSFFTMGKTHMVSNQLSSIESHMHTMESKLDEIEEVVEDINVSLEFQREEADSMMRDIKSSMGDLSPGSLMTFIQAQDTIRDSSNTEELNECFSQLKDIMAELKK